MDIWLNLAILVGEGKVFGVVCTGDINRCESRLLLRAGRK